MPLKPLARPRKTAVETVTLVENGQRRARRASMKHTCMSSKYTAYEPCIDPNILHISREPTTRTLSDLHLKHNLALDAGNIVPDIQLHHLCPEPKFVCEWTGYF
jgi:hypothetical protein